MDSLKIPFLKKIKDSKKMQYFIVVSLCIIALVVVLISYIKKPENKTSEDSLSIYTCNLENKLSEVLSKVDGVGKVSVAITVESGSETVIAMKTTITTTEKGTETVETPVLVNGKVYVLKELCPKVKGVLIVVEGGNRISAITRIQQAAMSLLNIKSDQIEILSMK